MKKLLLLFIIPYWVYGQSIQELFDALKSHSQTRVDEMVIQKAEVAEKQAKAQLSPNVDFFTSVDRYTRDTALVPIAPSESAKMLKDPSIAQPFSKNMLRTGVKFTMPLFVESISTMIEKAKSMQNSAKAKREIDLLKNEALIVGSNANLRYLEELEGSLEQKENSLQETKRVLQVKVDSGRVPASALFKLEDGLNQIAIAKNSLELKKQEIISKIESLTGIEIAHSIPMQELNSVNQDELGSLKPLQEKIEADRLDVKAQKEKLRPTIFAHGSYSYSMADAYNNSNFVHKDYGDIGVILKIPLLAKSQNRAIMKSKVELMSSQVELEKLQDELMAKAKRLNKSLPLLENSISLGENSIAKREQLLKIAKVSYESARMPIEEYLRYEDDVVEAKAKIYQAKAQKWQTLMELAVIYANKIEEIVQ